MKRFHPVYTVFAFLILLSQARAESRSVLIQIKQGEDRKPVVTIHSDDATDRRVGASVDEAVKAIGGMKGWGSTVTVSVTAERGIRGDTVKKVLGAVCDNGWLDLEFFGGEAPKGVADYFLKTAPKPLEPKEILVGKWESDDADRFPVEFGADGSIRFTFSRQAGRAQTAKGTYTLGTDGKITFEAKLGGLAVNGSYTLTDGVLIGPAGANSGGRWRKVR